MKQYLKPSFIIFGILALVMGIAVSYAIVNWPSTHQNSEVLGINETTNAESESTSSNPAEERYIPILD